MSEQTPPSSPPPAAAPATPPARSVDDIKRDPLVAAAVSRVDEAVVGAKDFAGELTLFVDRDRIVEVCRAFKDDGFVYLVDLAGIDYSKYPAHTGLRFSVAYMLYSFQKNARVRLRVWTDETTPIPSVTSVWKTANWHERETFDMLGIEFSGHPNLERILMWDGFNGHPLRKDFPIRGIDTGARIYPEVFPEGGGPKAGSTGKDVKDVNVYKGDWKRYGTWPAAQIGGGNGTKAPAPVPAKPAVAAPAKPAAGTLRPEAAAPPPPTEAAAAAPPTEAAAPPATEAAEPPATGAAAPPATEAAAPPATEAAAPPATEAAALPVTEAAAPPVTETAAPPATEAAEPPAPETAAPPVTDAPAPATEAAPPTAPDAAAPATPEADAPETPENEE